MAAKKDKAKNIHPPEFPDPLKPVGDGVKDDTAAIQATADAGKGRPDEALPTTDELTEAVATGEAEPGPPLPPEEAEQITEADVVDLTEPGLPPVDPPPGLSEAEKKALLGVAAVADATAVLKQIVLGALDPGTDLPIAGAPVLFCYRPGKWRKAVATRLSGIAADGNVLIDLLINEGEAQAEPKAVRFGDGIANWKFPTEPC